jgi:hypothetical protein
MKIVRPIYSFRMSGGSLRSKPRSPSYVTTRNNSSFGIKRHKPSILSSCSWVYHINHYQSSYRDIIIIRRYLPKIIHSDVTADGMCESVCSAQPDQQLWLTNQKCSGKGNQLFGDKFFISCRAKTLLASSHDGQLSSQLMPAKIHNYAGPYRLK